MYALWAESELDAHRIEQLPPNICATQTKSSPGNTLMSGHNQQQRKGTHRGRNRYKIKGTYYRKSGISASKQGGAHHDRGDTRKCWNCHETGPIRQMCTHLSAIQMSPSLFFLNVNAGRTEILRETNQVAKHRFPCCHAMWATRIRLSRSTQKTHHTLHSVEPPSLYIIAF